MAAGFKLEIITPEGPHFSGDVKSLTVPGADGYLGVLKDHAPLVTPLKKGTITATEASGTQKTFSVEGGFLEVQKNVAVILAESINS